MTLDKYGFSGRCMKKYFLEFEYSKKDLSDPYEENEKQIQRLIESLPKRVINHLNKWLDEVNLARKAGIINFSSLGDLFKGNYEIQGIPLEILHDDSKFEEVYSAWRKKKNSCRKS